MHPQLAAVAVVDKLLQNTRKINDSPYFRKNRSLPCARFHFQKSKNHICSSLVVWCGFRLGLINVSLSLFWFYRRFGTIWLKPKRDTSTAKSSQASCDKTSSTHWKMYFTKPDVVMRHVKRGNFFFLNLYVDGDGIYNN